MFHYHIDIGQKHLSFVFAKLHPNLVTIPFQINDHLIRQFILITNVENIYVYSYN